MEEFEIIEGIDEILVEEDEQEVNEEFFAELIEYEDEKIYEILKGDEEYLKR